MQIEMANNFQRDIFPCSLQRGNESQFSNGSTSEKMLSNFTFKNRILPYCKEQVTYNVGSYMFRRKF